MRFKAGFNGEITDCAWERATREYVINGETTPCESCGEAKPHCDMLSYGGVDGGYPNEDAENSSVMKFKRDALGLQAGRPCRHPDRH